MEEKLDLIISKQIELENKLNTIVNKMQSNDNRANASMFLQGIFLSDLLSTNKS